LAHDFLDHFDGPAAIAERVTPVERERVLFAQRRRARQDRAGKAFHERDHRVPRLHVAIAQDDVDEHLGVGLGHRTDLVLDRANRRRGLLAGKAAGRGQPFA
jgi:hypothetical protein